MQNLYFEKIYSTTPISRLDLTIRKYVMHADLCKKYKIIRGQMDRVKVNFINVINYTCLERNF